MSIVDGVLVLVPPPPGYVVNFDNPQRQADVPTYWLAGIGLIFAMLFTAQRVYVKSVVVRKFQLDDCTYSSKFFDTDVVIVATICRNVTCLLADISRG